MLFMCFFFFNDTATTEIYTLSLHDALPILEVDVELVVVRDERLREGAAVARLEHGRLDLDEPALVQVAPNRGDERSEEHTSELQSRQYLVCRLLLEKKKNKNIHATSALIFP